MRALVKLITAHIRDEPVDLDQLLDSLGVEMTWLDKIELVRNLEGVEAVYYTISGKILLRKR